MIELFPEVSEAQVFGQCRTYIKSAGFLWEDEDHWHSGFSTSPRNPPVITYPSCTCCHIPAYPLPLDRPLPASQELKTSTLNELVCCIRLMRLVRLYISTLSTCLDQMNAWAREVRCFIYSQGLK